MAYIPITLGSKSRIQGMWEIYVSPFFSKPYPSRPEPQVDLYKPGVAPEQLSPS